MAKDRRDSEAAGEEEQQGESESQTWEEKIQHLCVIAKPLATKKLTKRIHKAAKKANKIKNQMAKGVREVQKALRKKETGIVVLAGNISPLDIISHIPVCCENNNIPYCYVPSKEDLGNALGSKRQTCAVLIKPHDSYMDAYKECENGMLTLPKLY